MKFDITSEEFQEKLNAVNQDEIAKRFVGKTIQSIRDEYKGRYDEYLVLFPTFYTKEGKVIYISDKCFALDFVAPIDHELVETSNYPYRIIDVRLIEKTEYLANMLSIFTGSVKYGKTLLILIDGENDPFVDHVIVHAEDKKFKFGENFGQFVHEHPVEIIPNKSADEPWLVP